MLVSLPLLGVNENNSSVPLNALDFLGLLVWLIGFIFEAGGDFQLARFKKILKIKGKCWIQDSGNTHVIRIILAIRQFGGRMHFSALLQETTGTLLAPSL